MRRTDSLLVLVIIFNRTTASLNSNHGYRDDMHLGGTAHEIIGREAAGLVSGNKTVNANAREQEMSKAAVNGKNTAAGVVGHTTGSLIFGLHFPPEK